MTGIINSTPASISGGGTEVVPVFDMPTDLAFRNPKHQILYILRYDSRLLPWINIYIYIYQQIITCIYPLLAEVYLHRDSYAHLSNVLSQGKNFRH